MICHRILFLLGIIIIDCLHVQCTLPVPPLIRKADWALQRYSSRYGHDPLVHDLLNVLVHDKLAKAFVSDRAIELALKDVEQTYHHQQPHSDDARILREVIYSMSHTWQSTHPSSSMPSKPLATSPELKQRILEALDDFFGITIHDK